MPGQIRRARIGDSTGHIRVGATDLIYIRLDTLDSRVQLATLAGAGLLTFAALPVADTPVWVQATTGGSLVGWRVLEETIPVGWTAPVIP
jgi:hypothetical protein